MIEDALLLINQQLEDFEKKELELRNQLKEIVFAKNSLLDQRQKLQSEVVSSQAFCSSTLTPKEKIVLFRSLFRGRENVYPRRRERPNRRPSYEPVGTSGWSCMVCKAAKANPKLCPHRIFNPLTDGVIYHHLAGTKGKDGCPTTIGLYPLLKDNTCWFLAVDFDKGEWQRDVRAFLKACKVKNVPAYLERSRSGNGAHVWIFFSTAVPTVAARRMGAYLITQTMELCPEIGLDSYDRFFPNQDKLPIGGFGNLIALPLQKIPREKSNSVFLNDSFEPYEDQWAFLSSVHKMSLEQVEILTGYFQQENDDTKIIIFSEWERMLLLVRELADRLGIEYAWHTGSVPQDKRREDIKKFKTDKACRLFLTTDVGSTGLNLQVANVVINIDLPWNPAKLEQRIARAWRKMQTKHVQVINLVTENSIEYQMLATLAFKQAVADAVIDALDDVDELSLSKEQWLKQLETLTTEDSEASFQEPVTVDVFKKELLLQFQDRIHLVQQKEETLLIVVDTKEGFPEDKIPFSKNSIEILDLQTYLLLQRLASQGLIQLDESSKKNLFISSLLHNMQKEQNAFKIEKVMKIYKEAKRKVEMSLLLQTGDFVEESFTAALKSVEIAKNIIEDLKLHLPIDIDPENPHDGIAKIAKWMEDLSNLIEDYALRG